MLSIFKNQEYLMKQLRKYRARMKMYADNTPHSKGPRPKEYKKAEKKMISYAAQIDLVAEKVIKMKGKSQSIKQQSPAMPASPSSPLIVEAHDLVSEKPEINLPSAQTVETADPIFKATHAPAVMAFVVFEYSESMARCIEDYALYSRFPFRLFYPEVCLSCCSTASMVLTLFSKTVSNSGAIIYLSCSV